MGKEDTITMTVVVKRPVGRPREGKVYVNSNMRMDLGMDVDIRTIIHLMPERYKSLSQFANAAMGDRVRQDKKELYERGLVDSPEPTVV